MMMVVLTLIFGIKINVKADSSTTYDAKHPYLYWWESDKQAINDLNILDNQILWNMYFNVPLRVANYCKELPNAVNNECPDSYDTSYIGMRGLNNGDFNISLGNGISSRGNPYSYYNASVDGVYMYVKNGFGNGIWYGTDSSYYDRINYGYIDPSMSSYSQAHKQNVYYIKDTFESYGIRSKLKTIVNLPNTPITTNNVYSPAFSQGNLIAYKLSYMINPQYGGYGDGSWSNTSHYYNTGAYTSRTAEALSYMSNSYGYANVAYERVRKNSLFFINDSQNYDYINNNVVNWYLQNNHFASMFDQMVYVNNTNYPGCWNETSSGGMTCGSKFFQAANPMNAFLSLYGNTFYDKDSHIGYSKKYTINQDTYTYTWYNSSVFGKMSLLSNSTVVSELSTSTIIVAQPYYYEYDDNGTPYYSDVWFMDIWFFGYLDNDYTFNKIQLEFNLENQLSTYGNLVQLDIISPDTKVMVISSVDNVSAISEAFQDSLINLINEIPVIGGIIALILNIILFVFGFIYNIIVLFVSLPLWIRGGFYLLFIAVVIKIISKLVRGG